MYIKKKNKNKLSNLWILFPCAEGNEFFRKVSFILSMFCAFLSLYGLEAEKNYDLANFIWEEVVNYT